VAAGRRECVMTDETGAPPAPGKLTDRRGEAGGRTEQTVRSLIGHVRKKGGQR
jgi:hypothetical protein